MGIKRPTVMVLFAMLGAATAVLPAAAGSEGAPAIEAVNSGIYYHYWTPSQVSIAPGGSIALSNKTAVAHGVEWVGGPAVPACEKVPVNSSGTGWSGTCTFTKPGTYTFYCTVHGKEMTGVVKVGGEETTPTTTTTTTVPSTPSTSTPTPTTPTASQPGATPSPTGPAAGMGAVRVLSLAAARHGRALRGAIDVTRAQSGGRLELDVLVARGELASSGPASQTRVGRLRRSSLAAGRMAFSVSLDARVARALARHRRLTLTVRIMITDGHGAKTSASRRVLLRG